MRVETRVIYIPDALVQKGRKAGVTNLSKFVREKLSEHIAGQGAPSKSYPKPATTNTPLEVV